jgi:hypothetical protein
MRGAIGGRHVGIKQKVRVANDGGHRRADLVAHVGEEIALGAVRGLGLVARDGEFLRLSLQRGLGPGELPGVAPDLVLRVQSIVDVGARADVPLEVPVRRKAWRPRDENPAVLPVAAPEPRFDAERCAGPEGGGVGAQAPGLVLGMDAFHPADAELILHHPAREVEPAPVEVRKAALGIGHPDEHRRAVGQDAETLLALADAGVRPLERLEQVVDGARQTRNLVAAFDGNAL